jgi:pimeloyl-ACP methyl ester carboxylesterase
MTHLVVLPGLDGTATLQSAFVSAVDSAFESVTVVSYPADRILDYSELEMLARAALPHGVPFVLLGESFSGPIALSIAADPPPDLVGVVLSTTFARSPVRLLSPLASFTRFAPVRTLPLSFLWWWLLGRWTTPQLESSLKDALLSVAPAVLRSRAAIALRVNVASRLRDISIPMLYLRATEDRLLSRSAGHQIRSVASNVRSIDIDGPHLLLQASPQASALAVSNFAAQFTC